MSFNITVIMPCYNCEKTIERAIDSIINQTFGFENIELILYDDASSDNTLSIINRYSNNFNNITYIHSDKNMGPGYGRNECIKKSQADFIMFLDSDDEFDNKMCEILYSNMINENLDLISCNMRIIDPINVLEKKYDYLPEKSILHNESVIFLNKDVLYLNDKLATKCLFKRNIIIENNIFFPQSYYAEDIYFKIVYMKYVKKAMYLKNYAGYIQHEGDNHLNSFSDLNIQNEIYDIYVNCFNEIKDYDLNFSYIFKSYINYRFFALINFNLLTNSKSKLVNYLIETKKFEENICFNLKVDFIYLIPNFLIIHNQYYLTIIYLKLIAKISNINIFKKIYRKLMN